MKVKISKYPEHRFYHNWLYTWFGYSPEQKVKVKIDDWDTWSMDHTLGYIIRPMLKNLHENLVSYPSHLTEEKWDSIIKEIIWSFEHLSGGKFEDWEDQFHSGNHDFSFEKIDEETSKLVYGKNDTYKFDKKGYDKYNKKIQKGFELFGKYYTSFWN